jgi:MraZ protein
MSGLKIVNLDSSSRILIPKDLIVFAGLEKQIVLSSSVNIIEVWDKKEYEISVSKSLTNFGDLAEEVMGDNSYLSADDIP